MSPEMSGRTFLYVIGLHGRNDVCKVGISHDVRQRIDDLQNASPDVMYCYKKYLFETRNAAMIAERNIHALLFRQYRSRRGEWFFVSPYKANRVSSQHIEGLAA